MIVLRRNIFTKKLKNFSISRCVKKHLRWYFRYIDFPEDCKKYTSLNFFRDIAVIFFDSYKVIHHSHITRKIHGYAHSFCNKKTREMEDKGQYFSCICHNGFKFDMAFLTKDQWLSLWQIKGVSLLGSGLANLKSYTIGKHIKFMDSIKYYQQPLSKLASSPNSEGRSRIRSLFLEYLEHVHPYYSKFFMSWPKEDTVFVLEYLASGKVCFPYEIVTGFNSLLRVPEDSDFWPIESFYSRLKDKGITEKEREVCKKS